MDLILCLDDRNGMSFNGRRQSADRVLISRILEHIGQRRLWIRPGSLPLFAEQPDRVTADPECFRKAGPEEYCFGEDAGCLEHLDKVRSIIVYRWNRVYPADVRFPEEELHRRRKLSAGEFPGSSHPRITMEIYEL